GNTPGSTPWNTPWQPARDRTRQPWQPRERQWRAGRARRKRERCSSYPVSLTDSEDGRRRARGYSTCHPRCMNSRGAQPRRAKLRRRIATIVLAAQLPAAVALCVAGGLWRLGLLVPVVLTAVFFRAYRRPFPVVPRRSLALLYVFCAWWVACVSFIVLSPLGLLLGWRAVAIAALAIGLLGIWPRPRVRRVKLEYPDLPPSLEGLTIAQMSDLHIGPFVSEAKIA